MKHILNSVGSLLLVAALLLACKAQAATTQTVWSFDSKDNITAPVGGTLVGGARAVVAPGQFSMGWLAQNDFFGSASGLWDLGRQGTITVENLTSLIGDSSLSRTFKVRVIQWMDGGIYTAPAAVSVPGATRVSRSRVALGLASEGIAGSTGWIAEESEWLADAGVVVDTLKVTGAYDGSVIDSVIVESAVVVPGDFVLSIQPASNVAGAIELSWPESAGLAVIESTFTPAVPGSWSALAVDPVVVNGRYQITMPADNNLRFFRLKR